MDEITFKRILTRVKTLLNTGRVFYFQNEEDDRLHELLNGIDKELNVVLQYNKECIIFVTDSFKSKELLLNEIQRFTT